MRYLGRERLLNKKDMNLRNGLFLRFGKGLLKQNELSAENPALLQRELFCKLIDSGADTLFGKEHKFSSIEVVESMPNSRGRARSSYEKSFKRFRELVPIRDYNDFYPYIKRLREGEDYITWNQKVRWFAKSSGTSADKSKYIPVTPDSLRINHYGGFASMLASYINKHPQSRLFYGDTLTLGGSVKPDVTNGKFSGDLSAILLKNSPRLAELFRTPSRETALISDFNCKIKAICRESLHKNVTSFAGVPSWNLLLMNEILQHSGKRDFTGIWPNMELFMHGGIGFEPYREIYKGLFPHPNMHYIENYNASEGYFGFQDDLSVKGMLFAAGTGVFFEFVKMDALLQEGDYKNLTACTIDEVEADVNYAVVISTVGGLWRYLIGDTVKFVSLSPHRFVISGRTKLYINAFGEELMIDNAEKALVEACKLHNAVVTEFTVAPVFMQMRETATKGAHKWVIEFEREPNDLEAFANTLDKQITLQNSDYEAKRSGNATMSRLQLVSVPKGTFYKWMALRGKVGGQNKVPRLYNTDEYVKELEAL